MSKRCTCHKFSSPNTPTVCLCGDSIMANVAPAWDRVHLEECYELIDLIIEAPYSALENIDIKTMARDLVAKHRSENA